MKTGSVVHALVAALLIGSAVPALAQETKAKAGAAFTAEDLAERAIQRRAIEAINWGMPVVNFDRMLDASIAAGGGFNQITYWAGLSDWKNQTLTPNSEVIYLLPFYNTKEVGPMVLEIPPAEGGVINGTIMDAWQAALEDVGPVGMDRGKGGKYLILPSGYDKPVPEGYLALPSMTFEGYALLRSVLASGSKEDLAKAITYAERIKLYPLSQAASPPATKFVDVSKIVFDSTIPYDMRFFRSLDRVVQYEPWLPRDKAMIDVLRTVGIEKGKPFDPDARTQKVLEAAALEAQAWLSWRFETVLPPYFPGGRWTVPAMPELSRTVGTFYEGPDVYVVDARGLTEYWAFSTVKRRAAGQFYLIATRDRSGRPLEGGMSYRLNVPANAPARQFWSVTVYDRTTHTFIRNAPATGRSSQTPGLQVNADGSVDIYFAAQAPAGKATNWIHINPDSRFEVLFRFYGPEQALLDKTWVLPDIELAAAR